MMEPFKTLRDCHVHIIGLGLMGASLAMGLRGKVAQLSGDDTNPTIRQQALDDHVIDQLGGAEAADILILAIPADVIIPTLQAIHPKSGALVMDLGGTKHQICLAMNELPPRVQAIGGHPMCGLAENGYLNAVSTLYAGARFILCETERTTPTARSLAEQLVATIGAIPLWMAPQRHDQLAGAISHLPHLMSFALMRLAMQLAHDDDHVWELAAGGFDGATRLARTNETMITGMFLTNPGQLRQLTQTLQAHLDDLTALLDDPDRLRQELNAIVEARRDYTQHYGERMIT